MSLQKNFKFFNHFGILQISVSYPYSYWYCLPSSDSESNSESGKWSRLYLEFNLSISASHFCHILVKLKVLGLLACGFGKVLCCSWFSPSIFWDLQKGQLGSQPHFSSFWLVAYSSILGSSFRGGLVVTMVVSFLFSTTK